VYWSAVDVLEVPPGVVAVTSTTPPEPAGTAADNEVEDSTTTDGEAVEPKSTVVPGTNPLPVTTTRPPPAAGPTLGLTAETAGGP